MRRGLLTFALLAFAPGVFAQDAAVSSQGSSTTMAELIKQGYEIKAAVPNGSKFIVFLQKENSAYACEFASLQNSRCGSIN